MTRLTTARRVAARVRAEREAALLAETREVVTVLRELDVALSLWPWWRNPEERMRFGLFADTYVHRALVAVTNAAPGEGLGLTGERLCERYAQSGWATTRGWHSRPRHR